MMIYTQGAVAQMDDTVKHWEHSHNGTVTVKKQQQQHTTWTGQYLDVLRLSFRILTPEVRRLNPQAGSIYFS